VPSRNNRGAEHGQDDSGQFLVFEQYLPGWRRIFRSSGLDGHRISIDAWAEKGETLGRRNPNQVSAHFTFPSHSVTGHQSVQSCFRAAIRVSPSSDGNSNSELYRRSALSPDKSDCRTCAFRTILLSGLREAKRLSNFAQHFLHKECYCLIGL
jgi:hypothetical protein